MERKGVQISVTSMLGLVALVAMNFWLFRNGPGWGFLGLYITKHVVIAYLCQAIGINQKPARAIQDQPANQVEIVSSPPA